MVRAPGANAATVLSKDGTPAPARLSRGLDKLVEDADRQAYRVDERPGARTRSAAR